MIDTPFISALEGCLTFISIRGIEQSKVYLAEAVQRGVAMLDASSSGNDPKQKIKLGPGYQVRLLVTSRPRKTSSPTSSSKVPFAEQLRRSLTDQKRIPISAVGLITDGKQAEQILQEGKADIVRFLLFNSAQVTALTSSSYRSASLASSSVTPISCLTGHKSSASLLLFLCSTSELIRGC
jgi:2,4-dienoyl-CoA reductase-like NADH-dependent reductase (Old Yellow Enzyme family)